MSVEGIRREKDTEKMTISEQEQVKNQKKLNTSESIVKLSALHPETVQTDPRRNRDKRINMKWEWKKNRMKRKYEVV